MKTGIVIINYNDFTSTKNLIDEVKTYSIFQKIVIVDNHSTDDSLKKLRRLKLSNLVILEMKENLGYSAAINFGSKYLIQELGICNIIISNPDIILYKEEDIRELLLLLKKRNVGVVGPTILENGVLNRGWKNPTPLVDSFLNLPYVHRFFRKRFVMYPEDYYCNSISKVEVVSGCFFCITSKVLEKIDFFDENIFLYYEENILAKKLESIGLSCVVDNEIIIVHNHSVTIDKNMSKLKKYRAQKRSQYYFQTTYQKANLFEKVLLKSTRFFSEIILSIYYFFRDLVDRIISV